MCIRDRFYLNRYTRLWPCYAVSLLLVIAGWYVQGSFNGLAQMFWRLETFQRLIVGFTNVTLVGTDLLYSLGFQNGEVVWAAAGRNQLHNASGYLMNPPSWSLSVELLFYVVAPFVVISLWRSLALVLFGIVATASVRTVMPELAMSFSWEFSFPYATAFFGIGACSYWIMMRKTLDTTGEVALAAAVVALVLHADLYVHGSIYLALALLLPTLFQLTKNSWLDARIGDLSYPIYVLHVPIRELTKNLDLLPSKPMQGAIMTIAASLLLVLLVERPADMLRERWTRSRLRGASAPAPMALQRPGLGRSADP